VGKIAKKYSLKECVMLSKIHSYRLLFRRFRPLGYLISRYLIILKFYIYEVATAEYCNLPFELGFEWPPHLVTSYRANYIKDNFQQIRITDVF